jgi:hypothetical protein
MPNARSAIGEARLEKEQAQPGLRWLSLVRQLERKKEMRVYPLDLKPFVQRTTSMKIGRIKTTIRSECGFHMNSIAGAKSCSQQLSIDAEPRSLGTSSVPRTLIRSVVSLQPRPRAGEQRPHGWFASRLVNASWKVLSIVAMYTTSWCGSSFLEQHRPVDDYGCRAALKSGQRPIASKGFSCF